MSRQTHRNFVLAFLMLVIYQHKIDECTAQVNGTRSDQGIFSELAKLKQQLQANIEKSNDIQEAIERRRKATLIINVNNDGKVPNYNQTTIQWHSSCDEALGTDKPSGVYTLQMLSESSVNGFNVFNAYCLRDEQEKKPWTIIQRRQDGSEDFQRDWKDYVHGFGNTSGEYWIGLERLHQLTSKQVMKLWVKLVNMKGETRSAYYTHFAVDNENTMYTLKKLGFYLGDAGDALRDHELYRFVTKDRDKSDCANMSSGAWWYSWCHHSNLNGEYDNSDKIRGMSWQNFTGKLKYVHMAIRPSEFANNPCEEVSTDKLRFPTCEEALKTGRPSGVYNIAVPKHDFMPLYCLKDEIGGKPWIVVQRRQNGHVDFQRDRQSYIEGFGDRKGEFWLGLELMHEMTISEPMELWIKLISTEGKTYHAHYSHFIVGDKNRKYNLAKLGNYSGNAGDALSISSKGVFLPGDDKDMNYYHYRGGWWYSSQIMSNLNGQYGYIKPFDYGIGLIWAHISTLCKTLSYSSMAIRPRRDSEK